MEVKANLSLAKRAVGLFRSMDAPKHIRKKHARDWLRSVAILGDRWVLVKKVEKKVH